MKSSRSLSAVQALTQTTKQLHSQGGEYKEEKKEEQSKVADLGEGLHDGVEEGTDALRHLQQLQNCAKTDNGQREQECGGEGTE